ncbi:P2X purinoceptor 5-like [Gracilinanus agilis]|uniref:P2X purinoceptor 5-like n=1 Tax=Gracilinanus agilis TaxID=191870 RepID=UPI001CFD156A|nr:P2X purinoceptor 5-like [Gracilinanus agilis]
MSQADCRTLCFSMLYYRTKKYLLTNNSKLGFLHRLIQLAILSYLLGWVFLAEKGYQTVDSTVESSVVSKVKGTTSTKNSEFLNEIWDSIDYVIPSQGENVFFIITNLILTPKQQQTTCAESPKFPNALCSQDSNCPQGEPVISGNGVKTGNCLITGGNGSGTCEIFAWCPVENSFHSKKIVLENVENFTIYIKNNIRFSKFNFTKTNLRETKSKSYLKSCHFGPKSPYCPIFRVGNLVKYTGHDFREMALEGGVIGIQMEWDCNLDFSPPVCKLHYSFHRLDNAKTVAGGYNFRFARYYQDANGVEFRKLMKVYGIRFDVLVTGRAGKFSIIPALINVGSCIALLSAGTLFCDLVLLYLVKKSRIYRDKKYEEITFSTRKFPSKQSVRRKKESSSSVVKESASSVGLKPTSSVGQEISTELETAVSEWGPV